MSDKKEPPFDSRWETLRRHGDRRERDALEVMAEHEPIILDEPCSDCHGVGHLGPATGASQRDYGRVCPRCDGEGVIHHDE